MFVFILEKNGSENLSGRIKKNMPQVHKYLQPRTLLFVSVANSGENW